MTITSIRRLASTQSCRGSSWVALVHRRCDSLQCAAGQLGWHLWIGGLRSRRLGRIDGGLVEFAECVRELGSGQPLSVGGKHQRSPGAGGTKRLDP